MLRTHGRGSRRRAAPASVTNVGFCMPTKRIIIYSDHGAQQTIPWWCHSEEPCARHGSFGLAGRHELRSRSMQESWQRYSLAAHGGCRASCAQLSTLHWCSAQRCTQYSQRAQECRPCRRGRKPPAVMLSQKEVSMLLGTPNNRPAGCATLLAPRRQTQVFVRCCHGRCVYMTAADQV